MWGSFQGLTLTREGWVEQLNPHGHGFIVQGGSVFKCVGVEPGTNSGFFLGDTDVGGMLLALAHLDQTMYVCFSATKTPKR